MPQGSGAAAFASGKHDLNTKTVSAGSFKDIVTAHDHSYVVWEPCLHLSRPPARLQRPAVYFTANLVLSDQQQDSPNKLSAPVLASFEPLSANVLEPLDSGRVQGAPNVYMSASKITKVAPKPSTLSDAAKSIRGATRRAFPLLPALFTRIRYSNLPGAVVASLHLEPSHILSGSIRILEAELTGSNAHIEDLTRIKLPLEACGGDETILLYKIVNDSEHPRGGSQISISIRAEVLLNQGSQIVLEIDWQTDLSHTLQSPLYQWSRPAAVSSHRKSHSIQSLGTLSGEHAPARAEVASGGVTFIFTRKPLVQASSDFKLLVHCNNRSSRPRRFGLMIVQTRKSWLIKQSAPADVAVSDVGARVFCTPPMERSKPSNALDLNADLRIGPLPPGACFEAHMSFVLLRPGVLDLGTIRIIDLDTRQTVDVEELLDIVAPDTCTSEHQARTKVEAIIARDRPDYSQ